MPDLTITWTLTDQEFALLSRLVTAEGKGERPEAYAARVGLKSLKGTLEASVVEARRTIKDTLEQAFDLADDATKAKALDPLGYTVTADGFVVPK